MGWYYSGIAQQWWAGEVMNRLRDEAICLGHEYPGVIVEENNMSEVVENVMYCSMGFTVCM